MALSGLVGHRISSQSSAPLWLEPVFGSRHAVGSESGYNKVEGFKEDKQKNPSDWLAKIG